MSSTAVRQPISPAALDAVIPVDQKRLEVLIEACTEDLLRAFGLGGTSRSVLRNIAGRAFRAPVRRFARQVITYDEIVGEAGLRAGGEWALEKMSGRAEIVGAENVPREGPLLIVANHPGLADAVALFAATPRPDLRVLAAERPFLEALPSTSRHLIRVSRGARGTSGPFREAARHLKRGGAILTFPGGRIEPDPAVLPGAGAALSNWSKSTSLFARLVPEIAVLPTVVSGVLSKIALHNPLIRLRRHPEDRRWLAATFQMLIPAMRNVTTRVEFGRPIQPAPPAVNEAVLAEMARLIEHR